MRVLNYFASLSRYYLWIQFSIWFFTTATSALNVLHMPITSFTMSWYLSTRFVFISFMMFAWTMKALSAFSSLFTDGSFSTKRGTSKHPNFGAFNFSSKLKFIDSFLDSIFMGLPDLINTPFFTSIIREAIKPGYYSGLVSEMISEILTD